MIFVYAAIRVRGLVNISPSIRKTLELLNLDRVNHLVLVRKEQRGMLDKAQAYITFGEVDEKTLAAALKKRARLPGNKRVDETFLKEKKIKGFEELAKTIISGEQSLQKLGIKPVLRLGPPKKGYERAGIKKGYAAGGALGYRAADINKLIKRMV